MWRYECSLVVYIHMQTDRNMNALQLPALGQRASEYHRRLQESGWIVHGGAGKYGDKDSVVSSKYRYFIEL
jgi:hypothetical protein